MTEITEINDDNEDIPVVIEHIDIVDETTEPVEVIEPTPEPAPTKSKNDKKEKKDKTPTTPPIIKKIKKHGHGHHGGSWKIAYADFVTAMMAFFLLMWLVASLNKAQKAGIADYFKQPLKESLFGGKQMDTGTIATNGGGADLKSTDGQQSNAVQTVKEANVTAGKNLVDSNKDELKKLEQLKSEINISMEKDPSLSGLKKQLLMDVVSDGLRIQLIDNQNKPMFDVGSDKISPDVEPILANIAKLLNSVSNKITIQGHTDAHPYQNPDELEYTNWELSTQRANAARRALVKAGMDENKVMTVSGFSSTVLLDKSNPLNPENRRISIIVMKKGVEEKINTNK